MSLHSDYEVRWQNFKGFKDTGWVKIKPITIILGSNNTGKTSLIAPLLLMNQTISSRDIVTPLILKGDTYDAGNINEIIHGFKLNKDIIFSFKYHIHKPIKGLKKVGVYPPGTLEVTFGVNKAQRDLFLKNETVDDIYNRNMFSFSRDENENYYLDKSGFSKLSDDEKKLISNSSPYNFLFSPNSVLSAIRNNEKKEENLKNIKFSSDFTNLLQAISYNYSEVRNILGDISYLGPIRENPHRYYEIGNESYETVGLKGENMPNLLKKYFDSIKDDLNEWVKKFGFGDSVEIQDLSKSVISIVFNDSTTKTYSNIANTGFGASQILPLIVQALLSPKESLTIAEQPEIHLNPRLQRVLADLIAFMASREQRIIVETHSEHLLLRLRVLVAENKINANDIAVYFVEKENGESHVREIPIKGNGGIDKVDWPKDFFGEPLLDAVALAKAQAKQNKVKAS